MVTAITKDVQNTQTGKEIADIVNILTKKLIGEKCGQVRFSYGDELCLDFGEMIDSLHPKLRNLQKGSWRFGARATPWQLKQADKLLVDSELLESDQEIAEAKQFVRESLENQKILKIEVNPLDLTLQLLFEENYELLLQPNLADSDLAYWELFMPTQEILVIGSGYSWSKSSIHDRY